MSQVVKDKTISAGRPAKYPWAKWFDGQSHRVWVGRDGDISYTDDLEKASRMVRNAADREGVRVSIKQEPKTNSLVIKMVERSLQHGRGGQ